MGPVSGPDETAGALGASPDARAKGRGALALLADLLKPGQANAAGKPGATGQAGGAAGRLDVYA